MLSQRRLSRRSVLTGLAGVAAGSVVGACGGANTPGGTTVLQVWGAVPPESGPGDVIAAFERKFPKIKIDYTRFVNDPQGNVKLDTALQGGTPIDVFFSYNPGLLTQRVRAGLAVDLTDRIKAEPAFAPMADPAKPQSIWFDGRLFSVVTVRDPFVVFVNQNMLDAAGLTIPDQWTIEDFNRIAQTLARPDQGVYGMLSGSYPDTPRVQLGSDYWYKAGGKESNFDHPAFRQQAQWTVEAAQSRSAFPYADVLAQKLNVYQHSAFLQGKIGLWANSPFNLRYINDTKEFPRNFTVSMVPIPRVPGVSDYWNPGSLSNDIMISAKSKNQDAAWDFVKFWATEGGSVPMIKSGRIPFLLEGIEEDLILRELLGPEPAKIYDVDSVRRVLFDKQTRFPVDTITAGAAKIKTAVDEARQQLWLGELSVDEWVNAVKGRADQAITQDS